MDEKDKKILFIGYYYLLGEYLKEHNLNGLSDAEVLRTNILPRFWFDYSEQYRIKLLEYALEYHITLDEVIYRMQTEEYQKTSSDFNADHVRSGFNSSNPSPEKRDFKSPVVKDETAQPAKNIKDKVSIILNKYPQLPSWIAVIVCFILALIFLFAPLFNINIIGYNLMSINALNTYNFSDSLLSMNSDPSVSAFFIYLKIICTLGIFAAIALIIIGLLNIFSISSFSKKITIPDKFSIHDVKSFITMNTGAAIVALVLAIVLIIFAMAASHLVSGAFSNSSSYSGIASVILSNDIVQATPQIIIAAIISAALLVMCRYLKHFNEEISGKTEKPSPRPQNPNNSFYSPSPTTDGRYGNSSYRGQSVYDQPDNYTRPNSNLPFDNNRTSDYQRNYNNF